MAITSPGLAVVAGTIAVLTEPASSRVVQYSFAGEVTEILYNQNNVLGELRIGDPFTGYFEFDITVPDDAPGNPGTGIYDQDAVMEVDFPESSLDYSGFLFLSVINDSSCCGDWFNIGVDAHLGDWNFSSFGVRLIDSSATVFESDALPSVLDLSAFDDPKFILSGLRISTGDAFQVSGVIVSLKMVPAPGAAMALALVAGATFRARRRRSTGTVRSSAALAPQLASS